MDSQDWDTRYKSADNIWSLTPNEFVAQYLEHLPTGSMIDLAGGEGRNALWFASRGWEVENVEFSKVALEKYADRAIKSDLLEHCKATYADVTGNIHYALRNVDLGVIAYLQIDSTGLSKAIQSLVSNIKPGGTFFGIWHARENLVDGYGGPQDPEVIPTEQAVREALVKSGISGASIELKERQVIVGAEVKVAVDLVVLAVKH
ncbi:MAG: class I SAM-dependent methyltransferase [Actinomycetes bacterium]